MSSLININDEFRSEWKQNGIYHAKSVIKELPGWGDVLDILNSAIQNKDTPPVAGGNTDAEVRYKNILAVKKLEYPYPDSDRHKVESDATFFFSLFFNQENIGSIISTSIEKEIKQINEELDIHASFNSLKICLSDKFVPHEKHNWDTCIMQLLGTNDWQLRDRPNSFQKDYVLEPGDVLFFKNGIEHQVSNKNPRSSLVGGFKFGDSHEQ